MITYEEWVVEDVTASAFTETLEPDQEVLQNTLYPLQSNLHNNLASSINPLKCNFFLFLAY
jgi:hypothetical protein